MLPTLAVSSYRISHYLMVYYWQYFRVSQCARYCGYSMTRSVLLEYAAVFPASILWIYLVLAVFGLLNSVVLLTYSQSVLTAFRPPVLLQYSQYSQHEMCSIPGTY